MKTKRRYSPVLAIIGLNIAISAAGCSTTNNERMAEPSSAQMQDQKTLGAQINDYNNQNNSEAPAIGRNDTNNTYTGGDASADPRANAIATDVNNYNSSSQPDRSASGIDAHPLSDVELNHRAGERQATKQLSEEVRAYNRNGGASNSASDDNK